MHCRLLLEAVDLWVFNKWSIAYEGQPSELVVLMLEVFLFTAYHCYSLVQRVFI
jgi:hypothetical protein